MATTTNYAWSTPDDTALVSAGASAMRTLGSAIDATLGGQKNIKQIVVGSTYTAVSNSTSTYADTGVTATITPTKNTNQVLVIVVPGPAQKSAGNVNNALSTKLLRGATTLQLTNDVGYTGTASVNQWAGPVQVILDSPATTSATTYKTQFANLANVASVTVNLSGSAGAVTNGSFIYLLEIGV